MYFVDIHTHIQIIAGPHIAIKNCFFHQINELTLSPKNLISVGLHPWHTSDTSVIGFEKQLVQHANNECVVAIGEAGLDKLRGADINMQLQLFEIQAHTANELRIPLIIHCVRAYNEILLLRKKWKHQTIWIFHGFNQNIEIAKECINLGCFLSFGPNQIKEGSKFENVFKEIPLNTFFLETDESGTIEEVYTRTAMMKQISLHDLQKNMWLNVSKCFNLQKNNYFMQVTNQQLNCTI